MASATQSRSDAVEGDELRSPQEDSMRGTRSTERELRDVRAAIDSLSARFDKLEGRGDSHTGSRLEQSLKEVDSESDGIHSLRVALDAKDAHLHSVLERLEDKNRCISARDAIVAKRDALLSKAHSRIDELQTQNVGFQENVAVMKSLGQKLEAFENRSRLCEKDMEILVEKDAMIKCLQASLEKNVAQRVATEHEIEAVRASCEKKLTEKDEKIIALEEKIRERDEVVESHEIMQRNAIQKKCSEMKALRTEFGNRKLSLLMSIQDRQVRDCFWMLSRMVTF
ncbi:hypothetical protein BSKO_02847 [Bryopsis sp. KO-2023]|nr:hypothetical protein BSKO_02847 [Bryopsis sp. KO-2023]